MVVILKSFYILVLNSAPQQGCHKSNINNSIYTYQNLVGLKRTKNRQTILQHIKNLDLDKLNRNYGAMYKTGKI